MQMQTLSARIPTEDMEWLVGLDIQGAVSPSDKLRALIGQMRRQHEGTLDYQRSLSWLRDLVAPFVTAIRGVRARQPDAFGGAHAGGRSGCRRSWRPCCRSARSPRTPKKRAIDVEEIVVQRCFQLLTSIMRLAVTRDAACYNPKVIDTHVPSVLEIADIVAQTAR